MKKWSAFSLIELIVTLSVIAILAAIVVPTFGGYQQQKRLLFARDILETELQKAFSSARSEPRVFGVSGIANSNTYTVFSCDFVSNEKCEIGSSNYTSEHIPFERGIQNMNNFFVQFIPPHGDIDEMHTVLDDENRITLRTENAEKTTQLKVNQKSGLIEKIYE